MPDFRSIPIPAIAIVLGAASLWLMLPRGAAWGRGPGIVLGAVALGLGARSYPCSDNGWPTACF